MRQTPCFPSSRSGAVSVGRQRRQQLLRPTDHARRVRIGRRWQARRREQRWRVATIERLGDGGDRRSVLRGEQPAAVLLQQRDELLKECWWRSVVPCPRKLVACRPVARAACREQGVAKPTRASNLARGWRGRNKPVKNLQVLARGSACLGPTMRVLEHATRMQLEAFDLCSHRVGQRTFEVREADRGLVSSALGL